MAACCLRQPGSLQPKFAEGEFGFGGEPGCRRQHAAAGFAGNYPLSFVFPSPLSVTLSFSTTNGPSWQDV